MAFSLLALLACLSPATLLAVRDEDNSSAAASAAANCTADDTHVCCMREDGNFIIFNPSHAQSDVKKCKLLSFMDKDCRREECETKCMAAINGTKLYAKFKEKEATEALKKAEKEREPITVSANKEYEKAVKRADDRLASAQKEHKAKSEAFKKAKQAFENANHSFKEAERALQGEQTLRDNAVKDAADEKKKKEKEATDAVDTAKQRAKAASKEAEGGSSQEIPKLCATSETCCCSVDHVPVRVNTATFLDWGKCSGPKPYPEAMLSYFDCDFMVGCPTCREQICENKGKGRCP